MGKDDITTEGEQKLVSELAERMLEIAAPEEIVLLPETAEEYFRDPQAVLAPRQRDEAVGFGLDLAMLTPYVLAVATPVVHYLIGVVKETAEDELRPSVAQLVRRLFHGRGVAPDEPEPAPALSHEQLERVHAEALETARGLGLDEEHAGLLARSVVGGLALG